MEPHNVSQFKARPDAPHALSNEVPLPPSVVTMLASRRHRLLHTLFHNVRDLWLNDTSVSEDKRRQITDLGWAPPRPSTEWSREFGYPRPLGRRPIITNGSGEDFLYMHREMIAMFKEAMTAAGADPNVQWVVPPAPGAVTNGGAVPPPWDPGIEEFVGASTMRRIRALKSDEYYWSRMRWWDREFKDPSRLRELTLGELGSLIEFSIHNDLHMRWSTSPVDPVTGLPAVRQEYDIDPRWDDPRYDWLGEFYSSHVNPLFWRLHGWVDDRIDDWFSAHEEAHPGEVRRKELNGLDWFEPGKWVSVSNPWVSGAGHHGEDDHDVHVMERVVGILFPPPAPQARAAAALGQQPALIGFGL